MDDFANMLIAKHESTLSQYNQLARPTFVLQEEFKKPQLNSIRPTDCEIVLTHQYFRVTSLKSRKIASEKKTKSPFKEFMVEVEPFQDFPDLQCELDYEEQESEQSCDEVAVKLLPEQLDNSPVNYREVEDVVKRQTEGRLDSIQEYDESQENGVTEH